MGKQRKSNISTLLPKAARPVTSLINPTPSPVKAASGKGFSGPMNSVVPKEARRHARNGSFDAWEPTSPRVSCIIGHIKGKKKRNQNMLAKPRETILGSYPESTVKNLTGMQQQVRKPHVPDEKLPLAAVKVPSLGHMTKFSGARSVLHSFD